MRLKLVFQLENNILDIQYRKSIISWIKHALQMYDENLFQEIYHDNNKKTFTFAPILSKPQFEKEKIVMQNNQFSIVFSAYNYVYALHLYNAFLSAKYQKFSLNQNSMTLTNIIMIPEQEITTNRITITMSSPIIVRNHDRETLKDTYYAFNKEGFEKYLKINIEEQLQAENLDASLLEEFRIAPIKAKKIVIPVYEKMIECSIGTFELQGNKILLNYLYRAGIRSQKSNGLWLIRTNQTGGENLKIKIYLKDWFYNAGIVGFYRIFKDKSKLTINDNYIELESNDLTNFANDYFNYFFQQYNVAERTLQRVNNNLEIIKQNLEKEPESKEEKSRINEIIKTQKKYCKDTIKNQLNKIKKFDEETYEEMLEAINLIEEIKEKEQIQKLEEVKDIVKRNLEKESINQKLTMNLFKNILSNSYFGQPSFLNVGKSSLSFEEQKQVMYKDYVSNIIETSLLREIIEGKYETQQIASILQEKDRELLTKPIVKAYDNIEKQIVKSKNLEEIKQYVENKVFSNCSMCENDNVVTTDYTESNFIPLAVSSENMSNFFWNQNAKFPICDICKLILFCIPAGVTSIIKIVKENQTYKEKEIYSFVNYDTSLKELIDTNDNLKKRSKKDRANDNPYSEMILDIVRQNQKISNWQLENIFVVEFEAEYLAYSRMEYFNITKPVALFFTQCANTSLNKIYDYKYRIQVVDSILKNKDILLIINNRIRDNFTAEIKNNVDSYYATKVRVNLNLLKKGEGIMNEKIESNNKKLGAVYNIGITTREKFQKKKIENKLDGYIYKMLNCIKQGNRNEFMDIIIRLHTSIEESISPIFIESMKENGLSFEDIGHSYLAGLASNRYQKEEEEKMMKQKVRKKHITNKPK